MFLFYFIFYGGALVFLGGAGAPASPSLAPHMNEEIVSQDHLHLCNTDTENTSLLVNNSNISLLFPPDTFMVITFAGALRQALLRVFEAELFSCADGSLLLDTKHRRAALDSRDTVLCCFHQRGNFFHH